MIGVSLLLVILTCFLISVCLSVGWKSVQGSWLDKADMQRSEIAGKCGAWLETDRTAASRRNQRPHWRHFGSRSRPICCPNERAFLWGCMHFLRNSAIRLFYPRASGITGWLGRLTFKTMGLLQVIDIAGLADGEKASSGSSERRWNKVLEKQQHNFGASGMRMIWTGAAKPALAILPTPKIKGIGAWPFNTNTLA